MGKGENQAAALESASTYLDRLHQSLRPAATLLSEANSYWRHGEGGLALSDDEEFERRQVVRDLVAAFGQGGTLSPEEASRAFLDAIFEALDLPGTRGVPTFETRRQDAVDGLARRLRKPAVSYDCYLQVEGMTLDAARPAFGRVKFLRFGRRQLVAIRSRRTDSDSSSWRSFERSVVRERPIWNSTCAHIVVTAKDPKAAFRLAHRGVRASVDTLAFLGSLTPYNLGWPYLPSEGGSASKVSVAADPTGGMFVPSEAVGPVLPFSWKKLRAPRLMQAPIRTLHRIARERDACEGQAGALILAACEWAGRATAEPRTDQSFVLLATALETMLLPETNTKDLTHRLAERTAAVVGRSREQRREIFGKVKDLYNQRSVIVHRGQREVSDATLGQLRALVARAVLRLLSKPRAVLTMDASRFAGWLNDRVMR